MAAKFSTDGGRPGVFTVRSGDFKRLVQTCENPPKASDRLRSFVAAGRKLVRAAHD